MLIPDTLNPEAGAPAGEQAAGPANAFLAGTNMSSVLTDPVCGKPLPSEEGTT